MSGKMQETRAACGCHHRLAARLYLVTSAQFSSVLVWPDDLADRLLDANHWASLAGAGADPQRLAARSGRRAAISAGTALRDLGRGLCRSLAQTARLARHPIGGHAPGSSSLGTDRYRHHPALAYLYPGDAAGANQNPGYASAP